MKTPLLIVLLMLVSCISPQAGLQVEPQWWDVKKGTFVADWPAPSLGVYADVNQRIEVLLPGSAADKAGIQVGDVLLTLEPAVEMDPTLDVQVNGPVPFTDDQAIWELIRGAMVLQKQSAWYSIRETYKPVSGPFLVHIQRDSQFFTFKLLLEGQPPWTAGAATPTPVTRALRYF